MATVLEANATLADLLDQLAVPPQRVLLRPTPGEATESDLIRCPRLCELIDGVLVEKAMGWYESRLAATLIFFLEDFLSRCPLGLVLDGSGMVRVEPSQVRLPDVSFISWDHFPGRVLPEEQILNQVPDLAVEILSPANTRKEMARKRREYFAGGARLVWEVNPQQRSVEVFTSPETVTVIDENGTLDANPVLPGFTLSLAEWFRRAGQRG